MPGFSSTNLEISRLFEIQVCFSLKFLAGSHKIPLEILNAFYQQKSRFACKIFEAKLGAAFAGLPLK